jgi:hypothetical protein
VYVVEVEASVVVMEARGRCVVGVERRVVGRCGCGGAFESSDRGYGRQ